MQFLWQSLNCDAFNSEPYFVVNFLLNLVMIFILLVSLLTILTRIQKIL